MYAYVCGDIQKLLSQQPRNRSEKSTQGSVRIKHSILITYVAFAKYF